MSKSKDAVTLGKALPAKERKEWDLKIKVSGWRNPEMSEWLDKQLEKKGGAK